MENEAKLFLVNQNIEVKTNFHLPQDKELLLFGNGWRLFKGTSREDYTSQLNIKMGLVRYPVASSKSPITTYIPLEVDFPIGSLEVVTSREALSYSQTTTDILASRLRDVKMEIQQKIIESVAEAPTLWEANRIINDFRRGHYNNVCPNEATWRGEKVTGSVVLEAKQARWKRSYHETSISYIDVSSIPAYEKMWIGINDYPKYVTQRVKTLLKSYDHVYFIHSEADSIDEAKKVLAGYGPLHQLSEVAYVRPIRANYGRADVKYISEYYCGKWESTDTVSLDDDDWYITCPAVEKKNEINKIERLLKELRVLGFQSLSVYWISPKMVSKYAGTGKNLFLDAPAMIKKMLDIVSKSAIVEDVSFESIDLVKYLNTLSPNAEFANILERAKKHNVNEDVKQLLQNYSYTVRTSTAVAQSINELIAKKPLLRVFQDSRASHLKYDYKQELKDYLSL
jgi:hypothetical protein